MTTSELTFLVTISLVRFYSVLGRGEWKSLCIVLVSFVCIGSLWINTCVHSENHRKVFIITDAMSCYFCLPCNYLIVDKTNSLQLTRSHFKVKDMAFNGTYTVIKNWFQVIQQSLNLLCHFNYLYIHPLHNSAIV